MSERLRHVSSTFLPTLTLSPTMLARVSAKYPDTQIPRYPNTQIPVNFGASCSSWTRAECEFGRGDLCVSSMASGPFHLKLMANTDA